MDSVKVSEIEKLFQMHQRIREPTRVASKSSTTINHHIYISKHVKPTYSGVLTVIVSDHYIIFPLNKPNHTSKTSRLRKYHTTIDPNSFFRIITHSYVFSQFLPIEVI